jgi:hypothetical protein
MTILTHCRTPMRAAREWIAAIGFAASFTLPAIPVLVLAGCISFSGLDPKSNYADLGGETILVLGVAPRYRVHVFKGERVEQKWNRNSVTVALNTFPEDGYIVAKLPARVGAENYGIGGILPDGLGGQLFAPCRGQKTMTFTAPSGKVVYVGDIALVNDGSKVRYETSSNFDAARAHLKARFPLLADKLTDGGFEGLELVAGACPREPATPIVITIPVRTR